MYTILIHWLLIEAASAEISGWPGCFFKVISIFNPSKLNPFLYASLTSSTRPYRSRDRCVRGVLTTTRRSAKNYLQRWNKFILRHGHIFVFRWKSKFLQCKVNQNNPHVSGLLFVLIQLNKLVDLLGVGPFVYVLRHRYFHLQRRNAKSFLVSSHDTQDERLKRKIVRLSQAFRQEHEPYLPKAPIDNLRNSRRYIVAFTVTKRTAPSC
mmetsp:Transcript_29297/g.113580  ORF Transcript_29297/g.113580 Transcript_29297/m.113580 type:complete len:209 (-) Transcript_29297:329-955(-)